MFASVMTALWWKLSYPLIIAETVLQLRLRSPHLKAESCITSLKCVTLRAVYYIPSRAPFLCSSKNYHSHLLTVHPKSPLCCRTVGKSNNFYQDTGRDRVRCGRAALRSFHYVQHCPFVTWTWKGTFSPPAMTSLASLYHFPMKVMCYTSNKC